MLSRTRLPSLAVAKTSLFVVWVFLRSDLVHPKPIVKPDKSCEAVDGVHKFYNTFVDNFVDCPFSVKGCEGIGRISSINCMKCCNDHKKDEGKQPWLIAVIALGVVIGAACVIGIPGVIFVVKARQHNSESPKGTAWDNISGGSVERLIGSDSLSSFDEVSICSSLPGDATGF